MKYFEDEVHDGNKDEQLQRGCRLPLMDGYPVMPLTYGFNRYPYGVRMSIRDRRPFVLMGAEPFSFPGLHSDIESIERGLFGGLGQFLEAAEEIVNGFF